MGNGHCFGLYIFKGLFGTLFQGRHRPTGNKLTECRQRVSTYLCKSVGIKVLGFCGVCRSYLPVVAVSVQQVFGTQGQLILESLDLLMQKCYCAVQR